MKKRITAMIVAAFLMLSAAACSNTPENQNSSSTETSSTVSDQYPQSGIKRPLLNTGLRIHLL